MWFLKRKLHATYLRYSPKKIFSKFCSENEIECNFIFEQIDYKVLKHSIKLNQSKITDFFK